MTPNDLLVRDIVAEMPRETAMHVNPWLAREVESMDRAVVAMTRAGQKRVLAIRSDRLLLLVPHSEGVDTVDWGEVRGLSVTTHRKAVHEGLLEVKYTLSHPLIEALNLEIDLTFLDANTREGLLKDLEPFTKSALP